MPTPDVPEPLDFWGILITFIISTVSAVISISRRVISGHRATFLWVLSEYLTAILCGYLVYHAYPYFGDIIPQWATRPIVVAVAAHSGGRIFQELEKAAFSRYSAFIRHSDISKK